MPNFTIEGKMKSFEDVQRNWMFDVVIPSISDVTNGVMGDVDDLVFRARTASIPARGNEGIQSFFKGMSQWFPGKPTFTQTLDITIEETQDQIVLKALQAWQENVFSIDPTSDTGGASLRANKRDVAKDVYIVMYKYNQEEMERKIRLYNCYPENVGDVPLDYTGNESVKYSLTLRFDFWKDVD